MLVHDQQHLLVCLELRHTRLVVLRARGATLARLTFAVRIHGHVDVVALAHFVVLDAVHVFLPLFAASLRFAVGEPVISLALRALDFACDAGVRRVATDVRPRALSSARACLELAEHVAVPRLVGA